MDYVNKDVLSTYVQASFKELSRTKHPNGRLKVQVTKENHKVVVMPLL